MNTDNKEKTLCDYGCGQEAHYTFKNGKHCCSTSSAKCPSVKNKLRNTVKSNIEQWHAKGQSIRHHDNSLTKKKRNRSIYKVNNHGKCDNPGCTNFNDGSYGSGRFCSEHCAYAYAANTTKDSKKRKEHYERLHKKLKETKWKDAEWICPFCQVKFNTRNELKLHKQEKHFKAKIIQSDNHKFCPYCGKEFNKPQSIGGHIVNCKLNPNKTFYDNAHKKAGQTYSRNYFNNYTAHGTIRTVFRNSRYSRFKNINGEEYLLQSSFERNVAERLNADGIYWENKTKLIYEIDGKTKAYRPDMTIPALNCYIEVKGWFSEKDQKKMRCVLKSNPNIKLYFIHGKDYDDFIARKIDLNDKMLMKYDNIDKWVK